MRERIDMKSPVREYRPPGSVRGGAGQPTSPPRRRSTFLIGIPDIVSVPLFALPAPKHRACPQIRVPRGSLDRLTGAWTGPAGQKSGPPRAKCCVCPSICTADRQNTVSVPISSPPCALPVTPLKVES